jgi:general secretion pathway protein G
MVAPNRGEIKNSDGGTEEGRAVLRVIGWIFAVIVILVLALVIVVEAVVAPGLRKILEMDKAITDCRAMADAATAFKMVYRRWPASLDELVTAPPPPQAPDARSDFEEQYLAEMPIDPWGSPYTYSIEDGAPVFRSNGPDRVPQTSDDIVWRSKGAPLNPTPAESRWDFSPTESRPSSSGLAESVKMDDVDHVTPPANPAPETPWTGGRGQDSGIRMHRMSTD